MMLVVCFFVMKNFVFFCVAFVVQRGKSRLLFCANHIKPFQIQITKLSPNGERYKPGLGVEYGIISFVLYWG